MKNRVTTSLYQGVLAAGGVSPLVQRRILAYATTCKVNTLLVSLASLPELVDDVDEVLKGVSAARVVAAWVARPGREAGVLDAMARSDKRQVVRAALASFEELEPSTYEFLAGIESSNVALALLGNPALEQAARTKAASTLGECLEENRRTSEQLAVALGADPDLVEAFFLSARSATALEHLLRLEDITLETQLVAVGVLGDLLLASEARKSLQPHYRHDDKAGVLLRDLAQHPSLAPASAEALLQRFTSNPVLSAHLYPGLRAELTRKRTPVPGATPLSQVRLASTPEEVLAAARLVTGLRQSHLVTALAGSPRMTPEAMSVLSPALTWDNVGGVVRRWVRDPMILAEVLAAHPSQVHDRLLAKAADPKALLKAVMLRTTEMRRTIYSSMASSRYLTPEVVASLPAAYLTRDDFPVALHQEVAKLLEDAFGEDPAAWEAFEQLAGELDSTSLADLIEAVEALHG
jgi:hypothetical protein